MASPLPSRLKDPASGLYAGPGKLEFALKVEFNDGVWTLLTWKTGPRTGWYPKRKLTRQEAVLLLGMSDTGYAIETLESNQAMWARAKVAYLEREAFEVKRDAESQLLEARSQLAAAHKAVRRSRPHP